MNFTELSSVDIVNARGEDLKELVAKKLLNEIEIEIELLKEDPIQNYNYITSLLIIKGTLESIQHAKKEIIQKKKIQRELPPLLKEVKNNFMNIQKYNYGLYDHKDNPYHDLDKVIEKLDMYYLHNIYTKPLNYKIYQKAVKKLTNINFDKE